MDAKDLELLTKLSAYGRWSEEQLSGALGITADNIDRRISLMRKESILEGFSAFIDRRMFGYETTFVKAFIENRRRDKVLKKILEMPQVAQTYPNIDDFAIVEIVHWDTDSLKSAIRALERIIDPMSVTARYSPLLPDEIPEIRDRKDLEILLNIVKEGRMKSRVIASGLSLDEEEVRRRIDKMEKEGVFKVKPMLREEEIQPCPCFSIMIWFKGIDRLSSYVNRVVKIARGMWDSTIFFDPPGIWIKFFGEDLYAMDDSVERLRREDGVTDLQMILPDNVGYDRKVDLSMIRRYIRKGPEREMAG